MTSNEMATLGPGPRAEIPEDIALIYGDPPLVAGEDAQAYRALLMRVAGAVQPVDMIEWLWVKDIVDCAWESKRARLFRAKFLGIGRKSAMLKLVADSIWLSGGNDFHPGAEAEAKPTVSDCLGGSAEAEERVADALASLGLDRCAVEAEAYRSHLAELQHVDRMIAAADRRRNIVIREIERRRSSYRASQFRTAANEIIENEAGAVGQVQRTAVRHREKPTQSSNGVRHRQRPSSGNGG